MRSSRLLAPGEALEPGRRVGAGRVVGQTFERGGVPVGAGGLPGVQRRQLRLQQLALQHVASGRSVHDCRTIMRVVRSLRDLSWQ